MYSIMLKSKLHCATVTAAELEYEGSLTIDQDLMDAVKMLPYEKILVANLANGERFETYAIPGQRGSGMICLNGATAHKGEVGDRVIIFSFALIEEAALSAHHPLVLLLNENNQAPDGLREI
jgi:aspartate 1-decarboxylase